MLTIRVQYRLQAFLLKIAILMRVKADCMKRYCLHYRIILEGIILAKIFIIILRENEIHLSQFFLRLLLVTLVCFLQELTAKSLNLRNRLIPVSITIQLDCFRARVSSHAGSPKEIVSEDSQGAAASVRLCGVTQ